MTDQTAASAPGPLPTLDVIKHLQEQAEIHVIDVDGLPLASVSNGRKLESILKFEDERLSAPRRKKGTAEIDDLGSFIDLVNRGKDEDSVLFALKARDRSACSLTAVLNYNRAAIPLNGGAPRFGDHRVRYAFPVSDEWIAWTKQNDDAMDQAEFAEFIENRVADLVDPPSYDDGDLEVDSTIEIARKLGGSFASVSRMIELSRGMAVNADTKVASAVNLGSGEGRIMFEEQHRDGAGAPLQVPSLFLIAIPAFDRGELYRIAVRLRYRLRQGTVSWFYQLYRPEKSFDHAFVEACQTASGSTGLSLFHGKPEA